MLAVSHDFQPKDLVAGHVALDFSNTVTARDTTPRDWLDGYARLLDWSQLAGVTSAADTARLRAAADRAPREAAAALGGLDFLVNNVGVFRRIPLEELREEVLDEAFAVNVKAAVMASQAAVPHMRQRGGGAIVNVASLGGLRPWRAHLPYCVSKAALVMATQCLALSLAPEIRVNAVAPGILDEPGADDKLEQRIPARRFGTQKEAVEAVLFLLAGGTYTTGEVLRVDGGRGLA